MCHAWPVVKVDWLFKDAHEAALKLVRQDFARLAIEESKLAVEAQALEAQKRRNAADLLDADARIAKHTKAKAKARRLSVGESVPSAPEAPTAPPTPRRLPRR